VEGSESTELLTHLAETGGRDNASIRETLNGIPCRHLQRPGRYNGSLYFVVGSDFKTGGLMDLKVEIEYLVKKDAAFRLQFDGQDGLVHRSYQPVLADGASVLKFETGADYGKVANADLGRWSTATFHLTNAVFLNSQKDGADFRLEVVPPDIYVRRVTVTHVTPGTTEPPRSKN